MKAFGVLLSIAGWMAAIAIVAWIVILGYAIGGAGGAILAFCVSPLAFFAAPFFLASVGGEWYSFLFLVAVAAIGLHFGNKLTERT